MKHKHITLLGILVLTFVFNLTYAGSVDIKTAKKVGLNSYKENYSTVISKDASNIFITEDYTVTGNQQKLYYVFNTSNLGYIIVAATDIVHPILAYSFESVFMEENQSPEFKYWMDIYKKQIENCLQLKLEATPEIEQEWTRLNVEPENFNIVKGTKDVTPLLTSTWNQDCCYNALCPVDASAVNSCGRAYVGCVATSMSQVMYYYRYPETGQGTHSYIPWGTSYGTQTANFGATTYDWNAMTDACTSTNTAIATLCYHAGVAVNMGYGPDGSGANTNDWVQRLPQYFKYSSNINDASKSSFSTTAWENLIKTELDAKRPIVYTGYDLNEGSGHAWNCDGYQGTDYFHMNWGWGGYYNGYFYLNSLNPSGYDFTSGQEIIYQIYPGTGYPEYCSGNSGTLTSVVGTLADGSGTSDYQNNIDCTWLISPSTPVDHIYINFEILSTEASNDIVTIYDGPTTSDPVLGTYSGSTIPAQIASTSPEVLIRFTTNGNTTGEGWFLNYFCAYPVYCTGTTVLTDASGSFDDGSGVNEYNNSSNCKWDITPTGAGTVTLHFNSFDLESTNDKVRVTDIVNSTLLGNFSGSSIPADVTSPSGQMRVIFTSNSSITGDGFSATYTSTLAGIEDYNTLNNLSVYPNPASEILHVSFDLSDDNTASVQMIDLRGQMVFNESVSGSLSYKTDINTSLFTKGIYTLRIITSGETLNKKVVIE